jgi:hypothetical protein
LALTTPSEIRIQVPMKFQRKSAVTLENDYYFPSKIAFILDLDICAIRPWILKQVQDDDVVGFIVKTDHVVFLPTIIDTLLREDDFVVRG